MITVLFEVLKVKLAKTGAFINRPVNKLYPILTVDDQKDLSKDTSTNVNDANTKRKAAANGENKRRFGNNLQ